MIDANNKTNHIANIEKNEGEGRRNSLSSIESLHSEESTNLKIDPSNNNSGSGKTSFEIDEEARHEEERTLFVGDLPPEFTAGDLSNIFQVYGINLGTL
jgi:RNA recognition motif-containing protein